MEDRAAGLKSWASKQLGETVTLTPLQGDASFRKYYRVIYKQQSYIAVDTPPDREDNQAFVAVAMMFKRQGIVVPEVLSFEQDLGFMLLSDLGDRLLLSELNQDNASDWYQKSMQLLKQIQSTPLNTQYPLPLFDKAFVFKECGYFSEWCLDKLLGVSLSSAEQEVCNQLYAQFAKIFASQVQTVTHRDYHARNLMLLADNSLGLIDFQDAMVAPITYDLVSLLKDCYVYWSPVQRKAWALDYYQLLKEESLVDEDEQGFLTHFDWVGLQRHIKVLGVFSRLKLRDNKQGYMQDTPRIMRYVEEVLSQYPELAPFECLFHDKIVPAFNQLWKKEGIHQVA